MNMRHAVIDKETKKVVNVIIYDGVSEWNPPANCFIVKNERVNKGDVYDSINNTFAKPLPVVEPKK